MRNELLDAISLLFFVEPAFANSRVVKNYESLKELVFVCITLAIF